MCWAKSGHRACFFALLAGPQSRAGWRSRCSLASAVQDTNGDGIGDLRDLTARARTTLDTDPVLIQTKALWCRSKIGPLEQIVQAADAIPTITIAFKANAVFAVLAGTAVIGR